MDVIIYQMKLQILQTDFSVEFSDPDGDGTYTGLLSVALDNDTTGEPTGNIKLTLNTDPDLNKTYQLGSATEGKVTIWDDDAPELNVSAIESAITEGDNVSAEFLISAMASANRIITVRYSIKKRNTGNFFNDDGSIKKTNLDFRNGVKSTTFSIPIVNDEIPEPSNVATFVLIPDDAPLKTYYIGPPPNNSSEVTIVDDDSLPVVSILPDSGEVAENVGSAQFMITATGLIGSTPSLMINATPAEDGSDFLTDSVADTPDDFSVQFSGPDGDGTYTGELSVELDDDEIGEATGDIKLTLNVDPDAEKTYRLGSTTEGDITIWDDDAPELSVSAGNEVNEDKTDPAVFVITAKVSPNKNVNVRYDLTESGDFIENEDLGKSETLDFSNEAKTANISISVNNDNMTEDDGTIMLKLIADNANPITYTVAPSPNNTAVVSVIDGGTYVGEPIISISAASTQPIMEGSPAEFTITAGPDGIVIAQPLRIEYNVTQVGNFIRWRTKRYITLNSNEVDLSIDTHDDDVFERNGSIQVTLIDGNGYTLSSNENIKSAIVNVNNDDKEGDEAEPRISVAHTVVTAILNNPNLFGSSSTPESGIPSPIPTDLPTVSIDATQQQVDEGNPAEFVITSSNNFDSTTTVNIHVNPVGEFFDLVEPKQISRRIQGQESVYVVFPTIDDAIAEADGRLEVTIIPDSSYKIDTNKGNASVIISDAVDRQTRQELLTTSSQAFLPDVVGNMAATTSDLISQRIQQGFSETGNVALKLGGEQTLEGLIEMSGEMTNKGSVEWREVLNDSSFAMTLLSGDDFVAPTTIWGIGDKNDLSSNSTSNLPTWSGDVFTGQFGIDALIGQEFLTGLSASITENDIKFGSENTENLVFTLNSTSLYPYLGWTSPNQDAELRAIAGYSIGEFTINQANYDFEVLASESYSIALAGSKELYSTERILNGVTKLNVTGNSWLARQYVGGKDNILTDLQTDAHYLRITAEGTHQFEFDRSSTLTPLISVGIRDDRKDQFSSFGMEFSGGFDYVDPIGLTLAGSGSMLYAGDDSIQKVSLKSTLGFDYGNDNLGLTFEVSPTWGQTQANVQNSIWNNNILANDKKVGQYPNGTQINSEIGYGFTFGEESKILSLYSNYEFDSETDSNLSLGTNISLGSNLSLDLERTRAIDTQESASTKYQFNGRLRW